MAISRAHQRIHSKNLDAKTGEGIQQVSSTNQLFTLVILVNATNSLQQHQY